MRYPASRREFVTRRAFVVTTASLLAALAGQACRPTNGERGSAHGGSTSETAPAPARQAKDQTPAQGTDAAAGAAAPPDLAGPADSTAQGTAPQLRGLVYLGLPDPDAPETIRAQPIERPLPFLRVVVNAHSASRLPGYRQNDGEYLDAKTMQPLAGGHYRLPTTRAAELPFRHPMSEM